MHLFVIKIWKFCSSFGLCYATFILLHYCWLLNIIFTRILHSIQQTEFHFTHLTSFLAAGQLKFLKCWLQKQNSSTHGSTQAKKCFDLLDMVLIRLYSRNSFRQHTGGANFRTEKVSLLLFFLHSTVAPFLAFILDVFFFLFH